jgi:predicted DNA-binding transcriptional regulator AlpA
MRARTESTLPDVLLRFNDLKRMGLFSSHNKLKRKIERDGFPPGIWVGENSKAWLQSEVMAWLASRPTTRPDTDAIKKSRARVRRQRRERAAQSAEAR